MEEYIRKKRKQQNKLNENKLSGQGAIGDSDRDSDRKMKLLGTFNEKNNFNKIENQMDAILQYL